jgi:hypothetical protein
MINADRTPTHHPTPHFRANLRFVSPEEFERQKPPGLATDILSLADAPWKSAAWNQYSAIQDDVKRRYPLQGKHFPWDSESIRCQRDTYTGSIITATGGGITDGHHVVRYHLAAEPEHVAALNLPAQQSGLKQFLNANLQTLYPQQRSALLLGGNTNLLKYAANSRALFEALRTFFQQQRIEPSYFWGQNSTADSRASVQAYYTAIDDTWRILKVRKDPATQALSAPPAHIADLKNTFSDMHLAPADRLYLGDTDAVGLSASEFNQAIAPAAPLTQKTPPHTFQQLLMRLNAFWQSTRQAFSFN